MAFPPPTLPKPRPLRPVQLLRLLDTLTGSVGPQPEAPSRADLDRTLAYLAAIRRGKTTPKLTIPLLRCIARAFPEVKAQSDRNLLLKALLGHPATRWRDLWRIWAHALASGPELVDGLAQRLTPVLEQRADAGSSLAPVWLPRGAVLIAGALSAPAARVQEWAETRAVPLPEVAASLQCPVSRGPGKEALHNLILHGSLDWWRRCPAETLRQWATETSPELLRPTADRLLTDLGDGANGPGGLAGNPELEPMRRWVDRHLGDPDASPAHWKGISDRARTVYRWMALLREFEKILEEFERLADSDRARFWRSYLDHLDDARFHRADVAVCMMVIGDILVVEFGTVNNACFFYEAPRNKSRRLAQQPLPSEANRKEYFKAPEGLWLGGQRLRRHPRIGNGGWLPHTKSGTWQTKFANELRWVAGIPIPNAVNRGW